jgi:hypothetical protein
MLTATHVVFDSVIGTGVPVPLADVAEAAWAGAISSRPPGATETDSLQARSRLGLGLALRLVRLAEDRRFELLRGFPQHAFQACALGH